MKRFVVFVGVAVALTACESSQSPVEPRTARIAAPNAALVAVQPEVIPGQYIVVFKNDVQDVPGLVQSLLKAHGAEHRHTYSHAIKGFAAKMSDAAAAAIARDPQVAYVEQDQLMHAIDTEAGATWGLDRVDQRALPLSGTYTYPRSGGGVTAHITDPGIRVDRA